MYFWSIQEIREIETDNWEESDLLYSIVSREDKREEKVFIWNILPDSESQTNMVICNLHSVLLYQWLMTTLLIENPIILNNFPDSQDNVGITPLIGISRKNSWWWFYLQWCLLFYGFLGSGHPALNFLLEYKKK